MTKNEEEEKKSTSLKWKLKEQPTVENLVQAVKAGILTKDEAHQIAIQEEDVNEKVKLLEDQLELLKDVIKRMSDNQNIQTIIKHVHEYEWPHYRRYPAVWMSTGSTSGTINTVGYANSNIKQLTSFVSNTLGGSGVKSDII